MRVATCTSPTSWPRVERHKSHARLDPPRDHSHHLNDVREGGGEVPTLQCMIGQQVHTSILKGECDVRTAPLSPYLSLSLHPLSLFRLCSHAKEVLLLQKKSTPILCTLIRSLTSLMINQCFFVHACRLVYRLPRSCARSYKTLLIEERRFVDTTYRDTMTQIWFRCSRESHAGPSRPQRRKW